MATNRGASGPHSPEHWPPGTPGLHGRLLDPIRPLNRVFRQPGSGIDPYRYGYVPYRYGCVTRAARPCPVPDTAGAGTSDLSHRSWADALLRADALDWRTLTVDDMRVRRHERFARRDGSSPERSDATASAERREPDPWR